MNLRDFGRTLEKHSPTILTGLAVAGTISTVIFAVKATPKALNILDEEKLWMEKNGPTGTIFNPTLLDIVKLTWKQYVPTAIMGGVTIGCIIGANTINLKRNAALISVYSLTEVALREYQDKVVETIGKNKERAIRDDVNRDQVVKNQIKGSEVAFTGNGEHLCKDNWSGRYFRSDVEKIRKAINDMNDKLNNEDYISLNEMYDALGLTHIKSGDYMGWWREDGLVDIYFTTALTEKDEPCLVLDYRVVPKYK